MTLSCCSAYFYFLGHPKYPNTVDADWKAHKEDMMHRPKWRGYIRTLKHTRAVTLQMAANAFSLGIYCILYC